MKQKDLKILEISVLADISAHEWPIHWYRPKKIHIGQFLLKNNNAFLLTIDLQ